MDVPPLRHMSRSKQCTKCGEEKPITEFGKHRLSKDGHAFQCKECGKKRAKIYRNTPQGIYMNIKGRTEFYGRRGSHVYKPLSVSKEDFVAWYENEPRICAYCDVEESVLEQLNGPLYKRAKRLTIDCQDNDIGYELSNLVLACDRCNFIKCNVFTHEETREIGQKYLKPKWQEELKGEKNE